jgi:MFS family permease
VLSGQKRPPLTSITIDDEKIYKPVLHSNSSMLVFKLLAASTVVNARVKLMVDIHKGDTAAAAQAMGWMSSVGAILEFMIGPLLGRLSDRLGRKTIMLAFPVLEMAGNLLVILNPKSLAMQWCALVPTIALGTSFFASMRAMMADVMSGRNIAENGFMHMAPAGRNS